MSRLKAGICPFCGKHVKRHDVMRITIDIGENNGQTSHKEAHLECQQKAKK